MADLISFVATNRDLVALRHDLKREIDATRRELVLLRDDLKRGGWLMAAAVVAILISIKFFE